MSRDDLLSRDRATVLRPWSGEPVAITQASGCTVTDVDGNEFLDFTSGYFVNQAGHCHPRIIAAANAQMSQVMQVSGKQTTPALVDLAERLIDLTPPSIGKVLFCTGGSEATEFGLKMARQHTGKTGVAFLDNAYHGLTLGAIEACSSESYRKTAGVPLSDRTYKIPNPYCYRCEHQDDCATQCLDEAEQKLDARPDTAAILAEPVQAVGGIIPPAKWWERLDDMRRKRGLLLFLDEIQTGLGRTGKMFAAEHYGLEPDILTGGKGLSGGVGSLAVAMCSDAIADGFAAGTTPTNGGNAVSAAAGRALIDLVIEDGLLDHCAAMGEHFRDAVLALDDPWVGDVRFLGLLGGVELVADRASKQVLAKQHVTAITDALHADGMLLTVSGPHANCLRLQPPLIIGASDLDRFADALGRALRSVRSQAG